MAEPPETTSIRAGQPLGWARAVVAAALILVAATVLLVLVPNFLLTHLSGTARSTRVTAATVWFSAAFIALAWALRRLQAHHVV